MKTEEEVSRIGYIHNLQQRVIELEQIIEDKNSIIEQQKQSIVTMKNQMVRSRFDKSAQTTEEVALSARLLPQTINPTREKIKMDGSGYDYHIADKSHYETDKYSFSTSIHETPIDENSCPNTIKGLSANRKSGLKIDLKKLKLKGTGFKPNMLDKAALNFSCKDMKSTGRSKRIKDNDSDSDINSYRYNTSKDCLRPGETSNISGFCMKVPNIDKCYNTKQNYAPSEAKSSARVQADWTYQLPEINDLQDSDDD